MTATLPQTAADMPDSPEPSTVHIASPALTSTTTSMNWFDRLVSRNAKALAALAVGGVAWAGLVIHSPSSSITATEWLAGGSILLQSLGVYGVTNTP